MSDVWNYHAELTLTTAISNRKKACVIFTSANNDFVRVLGVLQDDLEACICVNPFLSFFLVLMQPDSRSPVSTCFSWVFAWFLEAVFSIARGGKPESLKFSTFLKSYFVCRLKNFFSQTFKIGQPRNRWCNLSLTRVTPSCPTPCNGCVASLLTNYIRRLSTAYNLYQTITFLLLFAVEFRK